MSINKEVLDILNNTFKENFTSTNTSIYFSPGRVNLIGEHIDYLGGYVLPCSLEIGTYAMISKREDTKVRLLSYNFESLGIIEFDLKDLEFNKSHNWANYTKGVIVEIMKKYNVTSGFEGVIYGNIPNSSGLSSSASLELLTCIIVEDLNNLEIKRVEMSLISKSAENNYMNVNCGIMDQFIIALGMENKAIMLNTESLEYSYTNVDLKDYKIVIGNTKKSRGLNESEYNTRRSEADSAQVILSNKYGNRELCLYTIEELDNIKNELSDVQYRRAKHAITENVRVKEAYDCLNNNELIKFGSLLDKSHLSLKDDYEVSCFELDTMVELSKKYNAIGSRMTGAGFGGCTVSIVHKDELDTFIINVSKEYEDITKLKPEIYIASIGSGAKKL